MLIAASFIFCATAYGASSAAVTKGLEAGFTPELLIVFRMVFGCAFCSIVLVFRVIFEKGYKSVVKAHFTSGFGPIFHLIIGGLLNLAIPHSFIAIAQQWIPSAAVQLAKPITPAISQICGHFLLPDERFSLLKGIALVSAVLGVGLCAIPSFMHSAGGAETQNMILGYILLIISVSLFGLATVYFKWKVPNTDITISSVIQTGASFVFDMIWSLIMDGPDKIKQSCVKASENGGLGWIWPLMLGVLASGVAVHGFMYLVNNLGAVGANFVPFGQILVGVTLGVAWLKEWSKYLLWEVAISCLGILFLVGAIVIGFWREKEEAPPVEEEEDELEDENEEEENQHTYLEEI